MKLARFKLQGINVLGQKKKEKYTHIHIYKQRQKEINK